MDIIHQKYVQQKVKVHLKRKCEINQPVVSNKDATSG